MLHFRTRPKMKHVRVLLNSEPIVRGELVVPGRARIDKDRSLRAQGEGLVQQVLNIQPEGAMFVIFVGDKHGGIPSGFQSDRVRRDSGREGVTTKAGEDILAG